MNKVSPPKSLEGLRARVEDLQGLSIAELYREVSVSEAIWQKKGTFGLAIELFLGADAKNEAKPDFTNLGIELKSLPVDLSGEPKESTFVASINLQTIAKEDWLTSVVYKKLSHVLWLPYEASSTIPFLQRRVGKGFFWQPNEQEEALLKKDWQELTDLLVLGRIKEISARLGKILQIRPKAANGKSLCNGFDESGALIKTLPRGFYLRRHFTTGIMKRLMEGL